MKRDTSESNRRRTALRGRWRGIVAPALLLTALALLARLLCDDPRRTHMPEGTGEIIVPDSAVEAPEDSVPAMDSPATSTDTADTSEANRAVTPDTVVPEPGPSRPAEEAPEPGGRDTVALRDTAAASPDSADSQAAAASAEEDSCARDTSELWVYPDPSGGLHYREVKLSFVANRPAAVHYRFKGDSAWKLYEGTAIPVTSTTTVDFDAIDSCGRVMERRSEYYEIETAAAMSPCLPDMEHVKVGTMNFCIDRYEWPNRKGAVPRSYISMYQAMDSCFSVEKRLCTSEEWAIACGGPYTWKYPYGRDYERYSCVTHDTLVAPSGSKPECRGFYGVFDMSGNLLEWTSTKSVENGSFTYVMGGFWESGPKSACNDKRYSYYPQNRHNPVGFRCCRDLPESSSGKAE